MTTDKNKLNTTAELINAIREGELVVLLDDEDRENEGDLVMSARHVTPDTINFMAAYGRGLICMPLSPAHCKQLGLTLMVQQNLSPYSTNFTVSIEAARGVTTGISAADRAITILTAAEEDAGPKDIISPGHIFPLLAREGGVLTRAGHTEAVVDLVQLAGCGAAGVLVEILNKDGTMARLPDCQAFARQHGLKIGTIADLIQYRLAHEKTVQQISQGPVSTQYGDFTLHAFQDTVSNEYHLALVKGKIQPDETTTVRVHKTDIMADLLSINSIGPSSWRLQHALAEIAVASSGILVLLGNQQPSEEVLARIAGEVLERKVDYRHVGIGSQILKALGARRIILLTNAKRDDYALAGFDLEVIDTKRTP